MFQLPREMFVEICQHLEISNMAQYARCNKYLSQICETDLKRRIEVKNIDRENPLLRFAHLSSLRCDLSLKRGRVFNIFVNRPPKQKEIKQPYSLLTSNDPIDINSSTLRFYFTVNSLFRRGQKVIEFGLKANQKSLKVRLSGSSSYDNMLGWNIECSMALGTGLRHTRTERIPVTIIIKNRKVNILIADRQFMESPDEKKGRGFVINSDKPHYFYAKLYNDETMTIPVLDNI